MFRWTQLLCLEFVRNGDGVLDCTWVERVGGNKGPEKVSGGEEGSPLAC